MNWLRLAVGKKEPWPLQFGGFASGFLLTLPDIFPVLAPMQLVALVPAILALRRIERWGQSVALGTRIGLAYLAPQVFVLRLPPLITLTLVAYYLLLFIVLAVISWRLLSSHDVWSCLAFGAFLGVFDWMTFTLLPMWGTAQSLSRAWSWYPQAIAFTSVTGITGIICVLGAAQALVVTIAYQREQRIGCALALTAVFGAAAIVDARVAAERPIGHMKVGAVGWVHREIEPSAEALYAEYAGKAASQGARLVVSPETSLPVPSRFCDLSRRQDVRLVIGHLEAQGWRNCATFITPSEGVAQQYTKTHLTPFEHYATGTGQPVVVDMDGVSVGVMICQDDNYTDISRRYGVLPTAVVAIPTNDWAAVRSAHLQNTIHRAIESRFAIVRATSNGISAIISPTGQVLAAKDHFTEGPGLIVAEVPVYQSRTIFSRFGHWFVAACGAFLAADVVARRRIISWQPSLEGRAGHKED